MQAGSLDSSRLFAETNWLGIGSDVVPTGTMIPRSRVLSSDEYDAYLEPIWVPDFQTGLPPWFRSLKTISAKKVF
jgi:hypothetical protein